MGGALGGARVGRALAEELLADFRSLLQGAVEEVSLSGSLGRGALEGGDLDLLVVVKDEAALDVALTAFWGRTKDKKKYAKTGLVKGVQVDLFVCPPESRGAMWLFAMGPGLKNILDRRAAIGKGYKLSDKGLFDRQTGVVVEAKDATRILELIGRSSVP